MIILIDNYDSFTYNVYHSISQNNNMKINVLKNDELIKNYKMIIKSKAIIISPGPSNPYNSGECLQLMSKIYSFIPILGICLGHQIIGTFFKGKIKELKKPYHGKVSKILKLRQNKLLHGIPNEFTATRYHSLYLDKQTLPNELISICTSKEDGIIMALKHKLLNIYGVQFHPESIETKYGDKIISNFIKTL